MNKSIFLIGLLSGAFHMAAGAQTTEKIEKAHKDPATHERSAKADVLLIDKTKITPDQDPKTTKRISPAKRKKCWRQTNRT